MENDLIFQRAMSSHPLQPPSVTSKSKRNRLLAHTLESLGDIAETLQLFFFGEKVSEFMRLRPNEIPTRSQLDSFLSVSKSIALAIWEKVKERLSKLSKPPRPVAPSGPLSSLINDEFRAYLSPKVLGKVKTLLDTIEQS